MPNENKPVPGVPGSAMVREQKIELAVFLLLIVPSMLVSFFLIQQTGIKFQLMAFSIILRDLGLVGLILYFIWRNREPWKAIGWSFDDVPREVLIGAIIFPLFFFGAGFVDATLHKLGFSIQQARLPAMTPEGSGLQLMLAGLLVIVVALAEETIFRGYLMLRFMNITRNPIVAVLASSAIFSLGHGYQGSAGIVTIGMMGVVFALVYQWRQSLVASITIHFLQDFMGVVLAPLIGQR